jgi:hypothetical protein
MQFSMHKMHRRFHNVNTHLDIDENDNKTAGFRPPFCFDGCPGRAGDEISRPHAEERGTRVSKHLVAAILRDAALCAAPQDEGIEISYRGTT